MDLAAFDALVMALEGVRRTSSGGIARWTYQGRLVARQLDETHVVVRVPFAVRDRLVAGHPAAFGVPTRFVKHMKVVVDLQHANGSEVEEALVAAWDLQAGHG